MIGETLDLDRPARCEKRGTLLVRDALSPAECCPPEGCDVLLQNGQRYGWSDSNVRYELLGPAGTRTRVVGPPR